MKKRIAGAVLLVLLSLGTFGMAAHADIDPLYSPGGNKIVPPPDNPPNPVPPTEVPPKEVPPGSPKTGDINILFIEGIGFVSLGLAAAAAASGSKSRKRHYA